MTTANAKEGLDVDTTKKLRHLSLCSGYDGIGLGLERAGFDIGFTVHVEIEAFASWNLVTKIEAGALGAGAHYPDLKTFPFGKFRGCIDILSGGFPCQPFSAAGKGLGTEDPRHLFPYIKRGIEACRPAIVVLENVEGIVSAKLKGDHWNDPAGTPVLLHVIRELERVGYRATAVPTSASEVGAPHQRNRWFIIGVADDRSGGCEDWLSGSLNGEEGISAESGNRGQRWPSRPGEPQHGWEPPRVVGNAKSERPGAQRSEHAGQLGEEASSGTSRPVGNAASNDERGMPEQERVGERIEAGGSGGLVDPAHPDRRSGVESIESIEGRGRSGPANPSVRQTQPPLGRDNHGPEGGMDYAVLQESSDNRTDELRLLGNGVVPQCACDAVLRGLNELLN